MYVNPFALALSDPDALHAMIVAPDATFHTLAWGAEALGARWAPDRWWPTLRTLLQHTHAFIRESALVGLAGDQTEPDEPVGAAPRGFYDVRDWPADVGAIRDDVLAEMDRLTREDPHPAIREMAATYCRRLRFFGVTIGQVAIGVTVAVKDDVGDARYRILKAALSSDDEDGGLTIYEVFDELHRRGAFDVSDRLLAEDWSALRTVHLLAILSITLPAKEKLPRRPLFRVWVERQIRGTDPDRAEELLRGL